MAQTFKTPIADVERTSDCARRHDWNKDKCGRPRVKVTFNNGRSLVVHDDGSFAPWLGDSEGGA